MGCETEKRAPRRWRKRKEGRHKRGQDLLVVDTGYRAPRRCSSGLWRKKIEALRKSEKEIIEKQKSDSFRFHGAWLERERENSDVFDVCREEFWWGLDFYKGLYAKLGLHRYNMLQGTNLQLHGIEKYNRDEIGWSDDAYYITLVAEDPATGSRVTFQTSVTIDLQEEGEGGCKVMDVVCHIARPKDTATNGTSHLAPQFDHDIKVPEWPLKKAFADKNRFFYEVQESEWEENDWIRLYLELAFVTTNPEIQNPNLSNLKILNVVKETESPNERLIKCFRNAIVYIRYDQDLGEDRVCKYRAIVRRTMDLISKRFCLAAGARLRVKKLVR